jgi:ribosomal protein S18 acetylase RimI-like enzyme
MRDMTGVEIVEADLARAEHQREVVELTNAYARDAMGGGQPLSSDASHRIIAGLRAQPTTLIFLAHVDGEAVGIATCFGGFSTFAARPLINIHDLAVLPAHRGRGVARALLDAVTLAARKRGCCKVTLEVLDRNERARHVYERAGFGPASRDATTDRYLFYVKALDVTVDAAD